MPSPRSSLQHSALWFPDIPPSGGLQLNEDSFTGDDPLVNNYQPLSWIHFGGETGECLNHVQGVLIQHSHGLHGLQFVYDEVSMGSRSEKLGRCRESELQPEPIFHIDGPGGERINSVSVGIRGNESGITPGFLRHGALSCIKVNLFLLKRTLVSSTLIPCWIDWYKSRQSAAHWQQGQ